MNAKKLFWLLFLLNLFNYIDRQVLFSVFPLLQADLHITDTQLGTLASVFMLVYMLYAPLVGYFADRTQRQKWIGASALIWSAATMACAWVKNYAALLAARGLIGVGEAGFTTIAQPFLAENFPKEKRATLLAYFALALPIGSALGYLAGGVIGQHWGWRAAFMLVGVPGLFLGLLALTRIKDTFRLTQSPRDRARRVDYLILLRNKAFIFLCLAHAMGTFALGGFSAWLPTYFHRFWGFSVSRAGLVFGAMVVVCGALGTFFGGKLADKLLKKTHLAYFITIFASFLLAFPFAAGAVFCAKLLPALLLLAGGIVCIFLPMGPISAALVALTRTRVRSMAFAVNIFIIHALGDAVSPVLLGKASDIWGLKTAILFCSFAVLPACLFTLCSAWFARKSGRLREYLTPKTETK